MQVSVKNFAVTMDLGNNGIEFEVRNPDGRHRGDLRIGKATIEWCPGRVRRGNGNQVDWNELIQWLESPEE